MEHDRLTVIDLIALFENDSEKPELIAMDKDMNVLYTICTLLNKPNELLSVKYTKSFLGKAVYDYGSFMFVREGNTYKIIYKGLK